MRAAVRCSLAGPRLPEVSILQTNSGEICLRFAFVRRYEATDVAGGEEERSLARALLKDSVLSLRRIDLARRCGPTTRLRSRCV
jgi:hypothetical protein